jgi:benzodiazapine receptor
MLDTRRHDFRETGRSMLVLAAFIVVCFAAAGGGSLATTPQTVSGGWYGTLDKPFFTPPASVFGPVWMVLYLSMAVSAWLVWRREGFSGAQAAMALFSAQLVLNLLWSVIFFGLEAPGLALVEIVALWTAILLTILAFSKISRAAGWLLVPYLAWVTFATALNAGIWWLNG